MEFVVVVATRQSEDEPWDYTAGPVARFIDEVRAVRFAKSEIKDGWSSERVRVYRHGRMVWASGKSKPPPTPMPGPGRRSSTPYS